LQNPGVPVIPTIDPGIFLFKTKPCGGFVPADWLAAGVGCWWQGVSMIILTDILFP
jgi:hypothetical protein